MASFASFDPIAVLKHHRRELLVLILLALLAGGTWGFIELADEVLEGETETVDERLLLALRNPADLADPIGPHWVEEVGRDITALGGIAVLSLLALAVLGYLLLEHKWRTSIFMTIAVVGGMLLSTALKAGFDRPRPDLVSHGSYVYTASFPSGHSMMAAVTYLTLAALLASVQKRKRAKLYLLTVAVLLTVGVGVSRVYMGVHWPTDVLAGWTAGAVWALLCWTVAQWLQQRGQIEQEGPEPEIAREEAIEQAAERDPLPHP